MGSPLEGMKGGRTEYTNWGSIVNVSRCAIPCRLVSVTTIERKHELKNSKGNPSKHFFKGLTTTSLSFVLENIPFSEGEEVLEQNIIIDTFHLTKPIVGESGGTMSVEFQMANLKSIISNFWIACNPTLKKVKTDIIADFNKKWGIIQDEIGKDFVKLTDADWNKSLDYHIKYFDLLFKAWAEEFNTGKKVLNTAGEKVILPVFKKSKEHRKGTTINDSLGLFVKMINWKRCQMPSDNYNNSTNVEAASFNEDGSLKAESKLVLLLWEKEQYSKANTTTSKQMTQTSASMDIPPELPSTDDLPLEDDNNTELPE